METATCPHCEAPIKPTATFCLACDTAIVDTEHGLSVAEPVVVGRVRPVLGLVALIFVLAVVGGTTYGAVHVIRAQHHISESAAAADVRGALTLLVRAESGQSGACDKVDPLLGESGGRQACLGIVDDDPGAHLEHVRVGTAQLGSGTGTVRLRATVVDAHRSRSLDQVFAVVQQRRQWLLRWNGEPPV